jgi:YfiH family protein
MKLVPIRPGPEIDERNLEALVEWIESSGIVLGVFPALELIAPRLKVYVSSRIGGVSTAPFGSLNIGAGLGDSSSNVRTNRRMLLEAVGAHPGRLAIAGQVHGSEIRIVHKGGTFGGVDGLVTSTKGLTLAVSTADCYPIIIYSPPEKALAAIHVGRKGARAGIIARAARSIFTDFNARPDHTIALIGPGICRKCYVVWKRTAGQFPKSCRSLRKGKWHLDLLAFCRQELVRCGVKAKHIYNAGICTSCSPDIFFSHKRDGDKTGRHWTLATIAE